MQWKKYELHQLKHIDQAPKPKDVRDMTVHSIQKIEENSKEPKETLKQQLQCSVGCMPQVQDWDTWEKVAIC